MNITTISGSGPTCLVLTATSLMEHVTLEELRERLDPKFTDTTSIGIPWLLTNRIGTLVIGLDSLLKKPAKAKVRKTKQPAKKRTAKKKP
jgi:hypothetical protein